MRTDFRSTARAAFAPNRCVLSILAGIVMNAPATSALGEAFLVKDINSSVTIGSSSPYAFFTSGGVTFFTASTASSGFELWRTDGTSQGTTMVKDINPGAASSGPNRFTEVNGRVFFTADTGTAGEELWSSDGTEAGTVLVRDIRRPGAQRGGITSVAPLSSLDGVLLFFADDGATGQNLWRSDGTPAGTVRVTSFDVGEGGFDPIPTVAGEALFFLAPGGLWKSDGTTAGTELLTDGDGNPFTTGGQLWKLARFDGTLMFIDGRGLWSIDGTDAGTVFLKELSGFSPLISTNGNLFFLATDVGGGPLSLWKSDGTARGTVLVKAGFFEPFPSASVALGGTVFFLQGGGQLWRTDGSEGGTYLVTDHWGNAFALTAVHETLFFEADGRLWKSDGTDPGTVLVSDVNTGLLANANGTLLFGGSDRQTGTELWRSDGTTAGTVIVKNIADESTPPSSPDFLTRVDDTLYFTADDGTGGSLWRSDGTAAGTNQVTALVAAYPLTDLAHRLLFSTFDPFRIWSSDGTEDGTTLAFEGVEGSSAMGPYGIPYWKVRDVLYFLSDSDTLPLGLWKLDGRTMRASLVKAVTPSSLAGECPALC